MFRNPSVTSAFKTYYDNSLSKNHNNPALIERWGANPATFETQIMCLKMGKPIPDSKQWTEEGEVFGPLRWPYDAATEPNFSDPPIRFQIGKRLKAIGSTWWDWKNKRSIGVGFDFDSLAGHAKGVGISDSKLALLDQITVPWIEVVRSTRGNGRHIYIWFDPNKAPETQNHGEHAAIARSLIPMIKDATSLDIETDIKVDVCGSIMWFYHVNANKENQGYASIKQATQYLTADHVSPNWRDNLDVVSGSRAKVRVQGWTPDGTQTAGDELDEMTQAYSRVELDETHLKILEALEGTGHSCYWVHDHHLWQGHTMGLKQVFDQFKEDGKPLRGLFDTNSLDSDPGKPNAYMRPKPNGGWDVYRFGEGVEECSLWDKQGKWTHTTFNLPPTLRQICMACGGYEGPNNKKGYLFESLDEFRTAIQMLGSSIPVPEKAKDRELALTMNNGRTIASIEKKRGDDKEDFPRWAKGTAVWERWLADSTYTADKEIEEEKLWSELDNKVRAIKITSKKGGGQFDSWVMCDNDESWTIHPRENIKAYLSNLGHSKPDSILGGAIFKAWTLVNNPFGPEYPGGRKWNRYAPQFVYAPIELGEGEEAHHPTWTLLLEHCGNELDDYIPFLPWCEKWGIKTGGDYLLAWVACMVQNPHCKLPYLFMYGPQNSGKSSFHESLALLFTNGVEKADRALTSQQGYNGELLGAILAVVDEVDIAKAGMEVYNKLKEWVTGLTISIHAKYKQVEDIHSTLHFVQMANDRSCLPVFPGDTRITVMNVPYLDTEIPRDILREHLKNEGPHFMRTLLDYEVQEPTGRLALPIIETQGKIDAASSNVDDLGQFIADNVYEIEGGAIKVTDFVDRFTAQLEPHLLNEYPVRKIKQVLMENFLFGYGTGRLKQLIIGNVSFDSETTPSIPFRKEGNRLVRKEEE